MSAWAAEQLPQSDSTPLLLALIGVLGIAITAAGGVLVAWITARGRTSPSPPAPDPSTSRLGERVAVTESRLDGHDELAERSEDRDEMQDRRLNRLELRMERIEGQQP